MTVGLRLTSCVGTPYYTEDGHPRILTLKARPHRGRNHEAHSDFSTRRLPSRVSGKRRQHTARRQRRLYTAQRGRAAVPRWHAAAMRHPQLVASPLGRYIYRSGPRYLINNPYGAAYPEADRAVVGVGLRPDARPQV